MPHRDEQDAAGGSLRQLARVTQRRWPFLLITVLVAVAASLALSARQPDRYRAKSSVLLTQSNVGLELSGLRSDEVTDPAALTRRAQNQAEIADNERLAGMALKASGFRGVRPDQLRAETSVDPASQADILDFTVTSGNPDYAVRTSRAWAQQYIEYRQQTDLEAIRRARSQVRRQLEQLKSSGADQGLYEDLLARDRQLQGLEVLQTPNAQVADLATGAVKTQPKPRRNALLALALGLVLGIILMFVREATDRRLDDPAEIEDALALPYLGTVPAGGGLWEDLPSATTSIDRYDVLRAEIAVQLPATGEPPVLAVTGLGDGQARGTVASALALAWSRAGSQVVVVNLDTLGHAHASALGVTRTDGVSPFIAGDAPLASAVSWITPAAGEHATESGSVGVVVSPAATVGGGRALGDTDLRRLIAEARRLADVVLVQTGPLERSGAAVTALALSDAVVAVLEADVVTREHLAEARRLVGRSLPPTLGFVLADGSA